MNSLFLATSLAAVLLSPPADDAVESARALLRSKQLLKVGNYYVLRDEADLKSAFDEVGRLGRRLTVLEKRQRKSAGKPNKQGSASDAAAQNERMIKEIQRRIEALDEAFKRAISNTERNKIVRERNLLRMELEKRIRARDGRTDKKRPASATEARIREIEREIEELDARYLQASSTKARNRIVNRRNELRKELDELIKSRPPQGKDEKPDAEPTPIDPISSARAELQEKVSNLRTKIQYIKESYAALAKDPAVVQAIDTLNQHEGKKRKLGPKPTLKNYEQKLGKMGAVTPPKADPGKAKPPTPQTMSQTLR